MKQIKHENFVGIYEEFFNVDFCENLIAHYEWCVKNNRSFGRPEIETQKSDNSAVLNPSSIEEINFSHPNISSFLLDFNKVFWDECYADYSDKYSALRDYTEHTIYTYKIQKTQPTEGYHIWHAEDGTQEYSRRIGVYILYLNDVEEGGETEFLYFSKRYRPKAGTLLIFPPNYPWAHRGNPPLSGTKYIMTGWIEFK